MANNEVTLVYNIVIPLEIVTKDSKSKISAAYMVVDVVKMGLLSPQLTPLIFYDYWHQMIHTLQLQTLKLIGMPSPPPLRYDVHKQ